MTTFLDRLTELCGPEAAKQLQAEFAGTSCYFPETKPPIEVVLHAHINPAHSIKQFVANLEVGLQALAAGGLGVAVMGVRAQGMGHGYLDALNAPTRRLGIELRAML